MRFFERWKASWIAPGQGRGAIGLRVFIYLLMLLAVWILVMADKPWEFAEKIAELRANGKKLELHHHVAAGLFYGAIINLVLGGIVLWLRPRWGIRLHRTAAMPNFENRLPGWAFWGGLLLAVVLAGALRVNLAKGSLWWDELWNVEHTMSGEFRPDKKKGGELRFREATWEQTIYYYRKPTNHPPVSLASRASLQAWRKLSGAPREAFNEVAVRLPSILAGLASVAAVGVLVRSWGFGAGGLAAAFLLALHPWHLRYGVDGRAYSFAVLWTILGCLWLGKLLRSGDDGWRYWFLFGFNQLMLVWSLPNGIYYAFSFGVLALWYCATRPREHRGAVFPRLLAVNITAAMLFIFLFLPNALQIREWGEVNDHHYLSASVLENVGSNLAFGMEHRIPGTLEAAGLVSFETALDANPALGWTTIFLTSIALFAGIAGLRRRSPRRSLLLMAICGGAAMSLLVTWQLHQHFYQRYVVSYLITPTVILVGIGSVELARLVALRARPSWLPGLTALLVVGSFAAFTRDQRVVLNTRSYAPFREVAEFVEREARIQPITVIGYGLGGQRFQIYYPKSKFAHTLEELDAELGAAEVRGGPVFIMFGYPEFNSEDAGCKAGAAKVQDPALFTEVAAYGGIDPMFYFRVMRRNPNTDQDG